MQIHSLKHTPQSVDRNPNVSIQISSRGSQAPTPPCLCTTSVLNVYFATDCCACFPTPRVVTWHSGTSRCMYDGCSSVVRASMSCIFSPSGSEGWGRGCGLNITALRNGCRLFLTVFDRRFQVVQTGEYGCNNKKERSSCPPFLLLRLPVVALTHRHGHGVTGTHSWGT